MEINDALKEFHDHKSMILSSSVQYRKARNIINNWYIPKLELLQSVTSSIHDNGVAIQWSADSTERCHITKIKKPSDLTNNQAYESQICRHLDCRGKCRQFDLATAICEAHHDVFGPNNMPHIGLEDGSDNGGSNNSDDEPEGCIPHCVTTEARHLRTIAPVSGTARRNGDYFELASALQCDLYPNARLPFRTVVHGETALHLTRDPTMKTMTIGDVMDKFNLPDLCGTLTDFLDHVNNEQPLKIGSHRAANANSPLPFNHLQVWTKVQVQN